MITNAVEKVSLMRERKKPAGIATLPASVVDNKKNKALL
jgi:hypothetical protein